MEGNVSDGDLLRNRISDYGFQLDSSFALYIPSNATGLAESFPHDLPMYLRVTVCVFIVIILSVGTVGNTMIALVIGCSKDMKTSTNFFLANLSVADLLVLVLVTPTALLEVIYHPEIWMLGRNLCKLLFPLAFTNLVAVLIKLGLIIRSESETAWSVLLEGVSLHKLIRIPNLSLPDCS